MSRYTSQELIEVRKEKFIKGDGWIYEDELETITRRGREYFNKKYYSNPYRNLVMTIQNKLYHLYRIVFDEYSDERKVIENLLLMNRGLFFNHRVMVDNHIDTIKPDLEKFMSRYDKSLMREINSTIFDCYRSRIGFNNEWYEENPTSSMDLYTYHKYGWGKNPYDLKGFVEDGITKELDEGDFDE